MRLATIVFATIMGCGGDPAPDYSAAIAQCNRLAENICARWVACGGTGSTMAQCSTAIQDQVGCWGAKGTGSSYSACISDLQDKACAELFPGGAMALPTTCRGVILK